MDFGKMEKKKKGDQMKVWPIAVCLVLAVAVFVFLLSIEKRQLDNYEKGVVVVAVQDVPDNTEITGENAAAYLALEERSLTDIPEAACTDIHELLGLYAEGGIDKGSMITESMFSAYEPLSADAVLLGVDMEALDQSVAGTLRAGDKIGIYTVKAESEEEAEVREILDSVVIERSYTSGGAAIPKEDATSIAQYITIPIHKDAVDAFYGALENRKIQIVKHPE